jgi:osmotically-inducible protein OsmY
MKTDKTLQHDVMEEIGSQPSLDATRIGVAAKNGAVTLTGHVSTYAGKCTAEEATKRVYGVLAVANDLEVTSSLHKRDDTDIAEAVVHALKWDTLVPDDKLKATVENGWVKLEGTVEYQFQKDAAAQAVRNLAGVVNLTNESVR